MSSEKKFYTVGTPGDCGCCQGGCTPVFTADMTKEEGPLFYIETPYKTQLAAELLGCSLDELSFHMTVAQDFTPEDIQKALKLYQEYEGFKKNGIASIGS